MRKIKISYIIHLFAVLHAIVVLTCIMAGIGDALFLTLLTMTMAVMICVKKGLSTEFIAIDIILVNILGFLLGTGGAQLLSFFFEEGIANRIVSTILTTELLGWATVLFTKIQNKREAIKNSRTKIEDKLKWILIFVGIIFTIRAIIGLVFSTKLYNNIATFSLFTEILSNSAAIITMFCLNIIFCRYEKRYCNQMKDRLIAYPTFLLITSAFYALLVRMKIPFHLSFNFSGKEYLQTLLPTIIVEVTTFCFIFIIDQIFVARKATAIAKEKARSAEYKYLQLKQQVNPHFLFNSLNILDCLVCEEKTEQASQYIHKLAGIYRYMLSNEDQKLVPLKGELEFVDLYIDLLQLRFPGGFIVEQNILDEDLKKLVVPCAIQLLFENIMKHNTAMADNPINIKIETDGNSIIIANTLIPKIKKSPSTGLGLRYIKEHYINMSNETIDIEKTEDTYRITIPLL